MTVGHDGRGKFQVWLHIKRLQLMMVTDGPYPLLEYDLPFFRFELSFFLYLLFLASNQTL